MNIAHFNETYREEYNDCFTITILPKVKETVTWTPPDIQFEPPAIDQFTYSDIGLEMGPYNP